MLVERTDDLLIDSRAKYGPRHNCLSRIPTCHRLTCLDLS